MIPSAHPDHQPGSRHVAVCIATYKRPQGLDALLGSLNSIDTDDLAVRLTLVIVDNAPQSPASDELGDISGRTRWRVIYLMESRRGIVSARNRCLQNVPADADFIAFLDDDETVSENWLREMLATADRCGAAAVQGPVEPRYERPPPAWIEEMGVFRVGPFEQDAVLVSAATNNSMIDAGFVREHDLAFDMRFNTSGGEDEDFYRRVGHMGGTIRAAADALVWDHVPAQRMTLRWVFRRAFRTGNTLGRIALKYRQQRLLRFAKGIGAAGLGGLLCLTLGFGSRNRAILGAKELCRGTGMLSAFFGHRFQEYSSSAVTTDRAAVHQHD